MTRTEARTLLDSAREGADIAAWRIDAALRATTGDIVDSVPILRVYSPAGTWERGWVPSPAAMRRAGPFDGLGA